MHVFVPPHPGPVAASGLLEANVGLVLVLGLIVAVPTWYVAGHLFGKFVGKKFDIPVPNILAAALGNGADKNDFKSSPSVGTVSACCCCRCC